MKISRIFFWLALLFILAGCTEATFKKREMFAEYGPNGKASYYRVTIETKGKNSEVDYRSGWYDAKAVDSLFGNISQQQDVEAATANRQKQAIRKTFDTYMDALEQQKPETEVETARQRYNSALQAITGVTTLGESKTSALDHANEKFVVVLSNDPGKVIQAIKEKTQQNSLQENLGIFFSHQSKNQAKTSQLRLNMLISQMENLQSSLKRSENSLFKLASTVTFEIADTLTPISKLKRLVEQHIAETEVAQ